MSSPCFDYIFIVVIRRYISKSICEKQGCSSCILRLENLIDNDVHKKGACSSQIGILHYN